MIETVVVSGAVMTKGLLGILVSLGFEQYMTVADATYLYNLVSVLLLLFIAAMSGPRSEAAFCIIVPIFAGIFQMFGWMRLTDPVTHLPSASATQGLIFLTVAMCVFGIFLYMKDQNKQNYGTSGPGSTVFNVAFYLMFFTASLTMVSGFGIFPSGGSQPIPGTCAVGFTCDSFNNIDFISSVNSMSNVGGMQLDIASSFNALTGAALSSLKFMITILVGIVAFPLVLNSVISGLYPGITATTNGLYWAFLFGIELVILAIYAQGFFELLYKPAAGTGSL